MNEKSELFFAIIIIAIIFVILSVFRISWGADSGININHNKGGIICKMKLKNR